MIETKTAALIIIGNEILSGRTQDSNLRMLAQGLGEKGVDLRQVLVIPDVTSAIVEAVNTTRAAYDFVFTTGGIGPTHDDITSAAVAQAFGVPIIRHPEAAALLSKHYGVGPINDARMKMAEVPKGAELIANPVSHAPGFRVENVYVLAGVPDIARAMFDGLKDGLAGGAVVYSRTVPSDLKEGDIAKDLEEIQSRFPHVEIGSYPFYISGKFGTSLVLRSADTVALDAAQDEVVAMVQTHGGQYIDLHIDLDD